MKRVIVVAGVAALVLGLPGISSAAAPNRDSVTGSTNNPFTPAHVSASSTSVGTDIRGSYRVTFQNNDPNVRITGEITCLRIVGNNAVAAGPVTRIQPAGGSSTSYVIFFMTDYGNDNPGGDGMFFQNFSSSFPPADPCPTPILVAPNGSDVVINNVPPL